MPNETRESTVLRAIKLLISVLPRAERSALRPWLLARYAVDGTESVGLPMNDKAGSDDNFV